LQEALYEGNHFDLKVYLESKPDIKTEIEKLKKRADKGAFCCPYCNETLILKSGEIREEHFAHRHSKSCEISAASEVYQRQVKRESKKHSVMKEIIYDELKTQEKINNNLQVDYGYITKAPEKWRYYPDIVLNNKGKELAITILTDVNSNKDEKLVNQIKKRNRYYKNKNLDPIWFIEDAEQSIDMDNHVIHLWEAELDIAIKTAEDRLWEATINSYPLKYPLFDLFDYYYTKLPTSVDIQSIYYVQSSKTSIEFTVQRFVKESDKYPYRAFALNDAYQISLSTALLTTDELQLSDPQQQREHFIRVVKQKEAEYELRELEKQQKQQLIQTAMDSFHNKKPLDLERYNPTEGNQRIHHDNKSTNKTPILEGTELQAAIRSYVKNYDVVSAIELSEYLVTECGASDETFATGRYKIYIDVCQYLDQLAGDGVLEFVKKDFVNDRVYKAI